MNKHIGVREVCITLKYAVIRDDAGREVVNNPLVSAEATIEGESVELSIEELQRVRFLRLHDVRLGGRLFEEVMLPRRRGPAVLQWEGNLDIDYQEIVTVLHRTLEQMEIK